MEDALADGAVGLSSGLDYLPSRFGGVDEVADMARPLAGAGRPYVSHLRGYGPKVRAGLDELAAVGRAAGIRVHASHLWGTPADLRAAFAAAEAGGVGVTFDMYPYRRSSTILAMLLLPPEIQARGPQHTLAALADPRQRAALLARQQLTDDFLQDVYLGCLPAEAARFAGESVAESARRDSRPPGEWVLDLLVSSALNVGGHLYRPALTEATWPGSRPMTGTAPVRTASTRDSTRIRADTARSPGSPGTTWPVSRAPGRRLRRAGARVPAAGPAPGGERG